MPTINGTEGNDVLTGTDENDIISGLGGNDTINGGDGNDQIDAGSGVDIVNGGAGNDTLVVSSVSTGFPAPSQTLFNGGSGVDTFDLSRFTLFPHAFWSFDSTSGAISVANYQLLNVERILGTASRDIFNFFNLNLAIEIDGGAGSDDIVGSSLADRLLGGSGDDVLNGRGGADYIAGGTGNDVIEHFQLSSSGAVYDGGDGIDTINFTDVSGTIVNLTTGRATGFNVGTGFVTLLNIENVTVNGFGSGKTVIGDSADNIIRFGNIGDDQNMSVTFDGQGGNDSLYGSSGNDVLRGGEGNDRLDGRGGADQLYGDGGDDVLRGGTGNDRLDGGLGVDTIAFDELQSGGVTVSLVNGTAVGGESGIDVLIDIENVIGSDQSDTLIGNGAANRLEGRSGIDTLRGGGGNDYLDGGSSADELYGEDGDDTLVGGSSADVIDGGSGTDTAVFTSTFASVTITNEAGQIIVTGTEGRDVLSGIEVLQFADGIVDVDANGQAAAETRRALTGTAGADTMTGGGSRDVLSGGAGNDILRGGGNNDTLDGGTGIDAALYSGARRQYVASSTSVSGNGEGTDTLSGIEEARFVDGVLTFDATSASAQVMRLYSATLNRTPDQGGLEANVGGLAAIGLQGLANAFVASAEFQARFGALNNQSFVEQLYQFALGRTGDPGGIANWVNALNGGMSRGQVVVGFSESAENVGRTAATLNAGLWVPDQQALIIARMYDATFDRLPDVGGLTGWVNALKAGTPLVDIAAAFAGSAEFQARYGTLSNQAFVDQLYRFCLNREGDPGGIAGWVATLNAGTSRASVLAGFSESPEHIALTAASWLGGIRFAGFVGAPVEDQPVKGLDDAQVLPGGLDHDGTYDPADFGLTSLFDKADDAFVLPGDPDGGLMPRVLISGADATMPVADVVLPMLDEEAASFVILAHCILDDPGHPMHRDMLDLAWA